MTKNQITELLNTYLKMHQWDGVGLDQITDSIPASEFFGDQFESLEKSELLFLLGKALWAIWAFQKQIDKLRECDDELLKLNMVESILHGKIFDYLEPLGKHGQKFKTKRPKGSTTPKTQYIRKLVADNPSQRAKKLYALADKSTNGIGDMKLATFENHVSQAKSISPT